VGLIEQIKKDVEQITSNSNDWAVSISFVAPKGEMATINGLHTKHHLGVDTDGNMVNSKKAHVSFSEKFLTDAGYPVRNAKQEVDLKGHLVSVKDSTGIVKQYVMLSWFPDETIGLIACILEDYE
jgi:hypothetical protein